MDLIDIQNSAHAIEIADRIWWVGHYLEGDAFQCHVYLIEHGDQSVLFDPGSKLTIDHTLNKIREVTAFSNIRYFVCHHPDPDITSAMPLLVEMITRDDALLVTHWRAEVMIRHYGLDIPYWRVDEHDWKLDIGGRELDFVFTPYAHFPGAFCTFDRHTATLFSSDIFGGFTEGFALVAEDESVFEALRPFHEHYMPNNDVLCYAVDQLARLKPRLIAPQHGSIIPEHLIGFITDKLKSLDCGLFLLAREKTDLNRLLKLNQILRDITEAMIIYRDFRNIAYALLKISQRLLPATSLEFYAAVDKGAVLHLTPKDRYRGTIVEPDEDIGRLLNLEKNAWLSSHKQGFQVVNGEGKSKRIIIPMFPTEGREGISLVLIHLESDVSPGDEIETMISQMKIPLEVAVERECIYRSLDMEKERIYESSIKDSLTGLFTRLYMIDVLKRLFSLHDRDAGAPVGMVLADIDHFKAVNDTYGHNQGDQVLKAVAGKIIELSRKSDLPVRLGGEEFAVFTAGKPTHDIVGIAERLRTEIAALKFEGAMAGRTVTASFGTAMRRQNEDLESLTRRADLALYEAKNGGRNRVCNAR